jgi:TetR/AcrR family transcriptional regulator, regulator of cefoperazone and chloramphenicol sensitivity
MFSNAPPSSDLTAKARIRDQALQLFAERGPERVTVRDVAAAADVSPGLVMHHFGSKAGLREAVDEHVAASFDAIFDSLTDADLREALGGGDATSLAEAFVASFPAGSALPDYLRRLWLTNDPTGDRVFQRWLAVSERVLVAMEEAGVARPSKNRRVRAALLLVNDLSMLLLAPQLGNALGFDLQAPAGMAAWAGEAVDVYDHGAFRAKDQGET